MTTSISHCEHVCHQFVWNINASHQHDAMPSPQGHRIYRHMCQLTNIIWHAIYRLKIPTTIDRNANNKLYRPPYFTYFNKRNLHTWCKKIRQEAYANNRHSYIIDATIYIRFRCTVPASNKYLCWITILWSILHHGKTKHILLIQFANKWTYSFIYYHNENVRLFKW